MKKLLFFILLFFVGVTAAFAQVPVNEQLTYQTVVRNAQNQLVFNQSNVSVTVSVYRADGTTVQYSETHTGLSTNANGLLTLMVGGGTHVSGSGEWGDIDWMDASIKTVISYDPGTGTVTITSDPAPISAVPYALSAGNMSNITNIIGDAIHDSLVNNISDNISGQIHDSLVYNINNNISEQIHDSITNYLTNNNTFSGSVTVPNAITPDLAATLASPCTQEAVNLCDLLAVFDSLNTRLNAVYDSLARLSQALEDLMNLVPPTPKPCTAASRGTHNPQVAGTYTPAHGSDGLETVDASGDITSVKDIDNNEYKVVEIGSQCWMAVNLRTTKYADNTSITLGTTGTSSSTAGYYYDYSSGIPNIPLGERGYLYNWPAAMKETTTEGTQGVCPSGWHLPTRKEWQTMVTNADASTETGAVYLSASRYWKGYNYATDGETPNSYDNPDRNKSGFSAVPAGYFYSSFGNAGNYAYFWSSSPNDSKAWNRNLNNVSTNVYEYRYTRNYGLSVRCVRDYGPYTEDVTMTVANDGGGTVNLCGETTVAVPFTATITGDDASDFTYAWSNGTSTTSKDTVALGEGTHTITVTATSSSHTLTASTSVTVNSGGTDATLKLCEDPSIGKVLVNSTNCTSLSWKNNSTNAVVSTSLTELAVGGEITAGVYTVTGVNASGCSIEKQTVLGSYTPNPCTAASQNGKAANTAGSGNGEDGKETADGDNIISVKDYDGNEYPVVEIGTQCWMAVNLRTTHYANGDVVPSGTTSSNSSTTNPYYYDFFSSSIPLVQRGYLYNWPAAMKETTTEGTQGVCPSGWHLPTKTEWQTMVDQADASTSTGAVYLSASCYWNGSNPATDGMTPNSYDNPDRNKSGFSAVPAGYFSGSSFGSSGTNAHFWSSSPNDSYALNRSLSSSRTYVDENYYNDRDFGFSVRCVRD